VENESFIELRDCFIKSQSQKEVQGDEGCSIEESKGLFENELQDSCFAINFNSLLSDEEFRGGDDGFIGVVSLQSTTIADFYYGVLAGANAICNLDKSSCLNMRGIAVKAIQPRILKVTNCVF